MDDLISRQAAIDALEELKTRYFDRKVIIGKTQDVINNLPSAQPEIIRCKDCKHWSALSAKCARRKNAMLLGYGINDFCSKAERRTDGEEVH